MGSRIRRGARAVGCLVGGAVGDALGAPVEFFDLEEIRKQFGIRGILAPETNSSGLAHITDDTQLVMFTAEGLLEMRAIARAHSESSARGSALAKGATILPVLEAYHRWLTTQGIRPMSGDGTVYEGMTDDDVGAILASGALVRMPRLHFRRAPGKTCLSSLETGVLMTPQAPRNTSKGCGGVLRAAPAGIIAANEVCAFDLGCRLAALTHGHPTGFISAGALAAIVYLLMEGTPLRDAAARGALFARRYRVSEGPLNGADSAGEETARAIERAIELASSGAQPGPDSVERLGAGWVADEALAIGLYAAIACPDDFVAAVRLAVNHSGDSDSTGSICGNIIGAYLGDAAIPEAFCHVVELRPEIRRLAFGLNDARGLTG